MDNEDKIGLKNAVNVYEETGLGAYQTIQKLTDMYVGDGSKNEELKRKIAENQKREKMSVEAMFELQHADWIIRFPEEIRKKLINSSRYIVGATCIFIQTRLEKFRRKKRRKIIYRRFSKVTKNQQAIRRQTKANTTPQRRVKISEKQARVTQKQ